MTTLADVLDQIEVTEDGWTLESSSKIWLIASVDIWDDKSTRGLPVFLGKQNTSYCWFYEFTNEIFAYTSLADAKAELADADPNVSLLLFTVNLGDFLRYQRARGQEPGAVVKFSPSLPFFRYINDPQRWEVKRHE